MNKDRLKYIKIAALVTGIAVIILGFFACEKYLSESRAHPIKPASVPTAAPTILPEPTPGATPTPDLHLGMIKSRLTGEWVNAALGGKRPIAVMLNNSKAAVPQNGLANAGVVYEATMEGNETRLMGIFEDYQSISRIGAVRSCRPYFVYFALEFQAFYIHYGQAWVADTILSNSLVENISGLKNASEAFYRSTDRKAPHNVFTDYDRIEAAIVKLGYERNYSSDYSGHYQFAQDGEVIELSEGTPAVYVKPGYPVNKPWFEYHAEDRLYYRFQYGSAQLDECTGQQVAYRNIIFQYADSSIYSGSSYVDFDVLSGGNGMYITNGKAVPVTWKKDSQYGATRYYDANGNEIRLNQGKTWVCVMPVKQIDSTVIQEIIP